MYQSNNHASVSASDAFAARRAVVALALLLAAPASAQQLSPRQIAVQARPGVVLITAKDGSSTIGRGSGFLVSEDGVLVTNRHVVEGATSLQVQLASGEIFDRVLFVSEDERRDLIVLRIPGSGLSPLIIADDRSVEVGDPVYVMGNPLGLEGTFSDGLVSARRVLKARQPCPGISRCWGPPWFTSIQ
jgi:serine protease Do